MSDTRIVRRLLRSLKEFPDNARQHSKKQLQKLAAVMRRIGFVGVIVIDEDGVILAGHARREAAIMAGLEEVDCLLVDHLTEAQKRAFMLADNKLGLESTWDIEKVALNLSKITEMDVDFDLALTGFDARELDEISIALLPEDTVLSPRDEKLPDLQDGPTISRVGDLIELGPHKLLCGDSRLQATFERLMGTELATMVHSDAPWNVPVNGHVGGSGKIKQREFVMASGEMSPKEFTAFLSAVFAQCVSFSIDGSIHFQFMDWRHMREMLDAGEAHYSELKNVIVWDKGVGGMGSFFRSRHELIFAFKSGTAPHVNNFELGQHGRYRTNVWSYRGLNTGGANRQEELSRHPTAKPVQMLANAMLDCSRRGSIVLDPFAGSGSTLIAAEKTSRRARLIELDPIYVDRIVRRWQDFARDDAVFPDTGETFNERELRLKQERDTQPILRPGRTPTSRHHRLLAGGTSMSEDRDDPADDGSEGDKHRRKKQPKGGYEIGYCRPPERTRFKEGNEMGKRGGRPKGGKNDATIITDILRFKVGKITLPDGRQKRVTVREVMLWKTAMNAMKGDTRAFATFTQYARDVGVVLSAPPPVPDEIAPDEEALLEHFIASVEAARGANPSTAKTAPETTSGNFIDPATVELRATVTAIPGRPTARRVFFPFDPGVLAGHERRNG